MLKQNGMYELTMYVPTRGRPENALRLEQQFYATSTANSRLLFLLSADDTKLEEYLNLPLTYLPVITAPRKRGFVEPLNLGWDADRKKVYSYAVGFMGDDHLPRTHGWDSELVKELKAVKAGFVYGNDKFQGENIPTHIAMTSDIAATLGFMTLPQLSHLYADNFWLDFGKMLGKIKYRDDIIIEHLHPAAGKAKHDPGYEFSGSFALDQADKDAYIRYLNAYLVRDVNKVKSMLERTGKL